MGLLKDALRSSSHTVRRPRRSPPFAALRTGRISKLAVCLRRRRLRPAGLRQAAAVATPANLLHSPSPLCGRRADRTAGRGGFSAALTVSSPWRHRLGAAVQVAGHDLGRHPGLHRGERIAGRSGSKRRSLMHCPRSGWSECLQYHHAGTTRPWLVGFYNVLSSTRVE